jgi:hypothetical protein
MYKMTPKDDARLRTALEIAMDRAQETERANPKPFALENALEHARETEGTSLRPSQDPTFPKEKNSAVAALLAVVLGPLGYLYIGWRYAVTATAVFILFILIFSILLFVPWWLKYINVLAFAVMAVMICQVRNSIVKARDEDIFAFNTFPVATFAMTTLLPMLVVVDTASVGVTVAINRLVAGETARGLVTLFLS